MNIDCLSRGGGDADLFTHRTDCVCQACQAHKAKIISETLDAPSKGYQERKEVGIDGWVEIIQGPPS